MNCTKCGAEIPSGNRFCANCGAPIEIRDASAARQEPAVKTNRNKAQSFRLNPSKNDPAAGGAAGFIQKNLLTILCVIAIAAMALPLCSVSVSIDSDFISSDSSTSMTGFAAMSESFFAILLVAGPAILIAMNYIKKLEAYQGLLVTAVPLICILSLIFVLFEAKSGNVASQAAGYGMEVKVRAGIGAILDFAAYLGMAAIGAVKYHNVTLNANSLERMKSAGSDLLNSAKEKAAVVAQSISSGAEAASDRAQSAPQSAPQPHRGRNNQAEDVLALIKHLHEMKESGILTEQEFAEKKEQLLSEI